MSDFITMQCPNCGGKLAIGANALSLTCEHCGAEHMIRREANSIILESYARCPVCNRNDKSQKVTALISSQTQNSQGVTYQTQTTLLPIGNTIIPVTQRVVVPIQSTQKSEIARLLSPPSQPQLKKGNRISDGTSHTSNILAYLFAIIGTPVMSCVLLSSFGLINIFHIKSLGGFSVLAICGAIALAPLVISVLLFIYAVPPENRRNQEKKTIAEVNRRTQQAQLQLQFDEEMKRWKPAMDRWNKLYYCERDDCIFIPNTNTSVPVTKMLEYIYLD
jgi:predicted RNA-binding Zn-ribbon protein involved in translation (DUF1610 family)